MVFTFALGIGQISSFESRCYRPLFVCFDGLLCRFVPRCSFSPYPGYVYGPVSLIIAEFLVGWNLRYFVMKKQFISWTKFKYYSFGTGIAGIIFIFLGNPPGYAWLFQRLFLGSGWMWIEIMALKLFLNLGSNTNTIQSEGRVAQELAK
jgi:hypothetical protein